MKKIDTMTRRQTSSAKLMTINIKFQEFIATLGIFFNFKGDSIII